MSGSPQNLSSCSPRDNDRICYRPFRRGAKKKPNWWARSSSLGDYAANRSSGITEFCLLLQCPIISQQHQHNPPTSPRTSPATRNQARLAHPEIKRPKRMSLETPVRENQGQSQPLTRSSSQLSSTAAGANRCLFQINSSLVGGW
jgi:hypothetical protein